MLTELQPDHPPGIWQLTRPALGHLVLLAPSDLQHPRARFAISHSNQITIGSDKSQSDIQFKHSEFDPVHLKLSIAPDHIGSIQVYGTGGVKLNNGQEFHPPIDGSNPPWITLKDGDLFFISNFPFKWEQSWDAHQIDWSRFEQDGNLGINIPDKSLVHHSPLRVTSPLNPSRQPSSPLAAHTKPSSPTPASISTPNLFTLGDPQHQHSSASPHKKKSSNSSIASRASPHPSPLISTGSSPTQASPKPTGDSNPSTSFPSSAPEFFCASSGSPPRSTATANMAHNTPNSKSLGTGFQTPASQPEQSNISTPTITSLGAATPRLVVTPNKTGDGLLFHWKSSAQEPEPFNSTEPVENPTTLVSSGRQSSSPASSHESTLDSWKSSNVSFRRSRSHRRSSEMSGQKRARLTRAIDDDSSSDEDDNDSKNTRHHPQSDLQLVDDTSVDLISLSPPPIVSPSFPSPDSQAPINEELSAQRSRSKSLLQKTLLKRAVEVHLAQQAEHDGPVGASGFSSSEDEEHTNLDEVDSTDDEIPSNPELLDDSSDEEQVKLKARMKQPQPPAHSINFGLEASEADSDVPSQEGESPSKILSGLGLMPNSLSKPSPMASPSSLKLKFQDRRSISPSAKLLANYEIEQSLDQPRSPPLTVDFPLKSSFRRQSYTPVELEAFSNPTKERYPKTPPSRPAILAAVKHNTQVNSRSPTHPIEDYEALRKDRRSSLRNSIAGPSTTPKRALPPVSSPAVLSASTTPHRLIRTPRSFLIKRGGSLTPLSASVCGPNPNTPALILENEDEDEGDDQGGKRKVRFDKDVFCLEFDQLPEELPASRQKRLRLEVPLPNIAEHETDHNSVNDLGTTSDNQTPRDNGIINSRAGRRRSGELPTQTPGRRRQSPRLPSSAPAHLMPSFGAINCGFETAQTEADSYRSMSISPPTSATVDLSGLSLSTDPPDPPIGIGARNVFNSSGAPRESLALLGGSPLTCYQHATEPNVSCLLNDSDVSGQHPSIFQQIRACFFNPGSTDPGPITRTRSASLPADISRLSYDAIINSYKITNLSKELDSLSLRRAPEMTIDLPERSYSAPSSSVSTTKTVRGMFKLPEVPQFSPQLSGVKRLFMDHVANLPGLNGIRNMIGGVFRAEENDHDSDDESSSLTELEPSSDREDSDDEMIGAEEITKSPSAERLSRQTSQSARTLEMINDDRPPTNNDVRPNLRKTCTKTRETNEVRRTLRPRGPTSSQNTQSQTTMSYRNKTKDLKVSGIREIEKKGERSNDEDKSNLNKNLTKNSTMNDQTLTLSPRKTRSGKIRVELNSEDKACNNKNHIGPIRKTRSKLNK